MKSVVIGSKVSSIGSSAFSSCKNLKQVTALNETPISIDEDVFPYRTSQILYVPEGCVDAYKAADVWKDFNNIFTVGTNAELLKGDMDNDGVISISDVMIIIQLLLGNQ